jgi:hypothetical protein
MSIEQTLSALITALNANTDALLKTGGAPEAKRGPGRPRKDDTPVAETKDFGPALPGDADGTSYFASRDAQRVAKFAPTDSLGPVSDRTKWAQISGEEYAAKIKALEAKKPAAASAQTQTAAAPSQPTAQASAVPAASATSTNTASAHSFESVQKALLELAQSDPAKGRERIIAILTKAGVKLVRELSTNSDALASVIADLYPQEATIADPLFG